MDNLRLHIGKRIRYYRKANGMTLSQLAEKICKSKSSVSKYENGEISIDIDTLNDIALTLNISLSTLIDYIPDNIQVDPPQLDGFFYNTNTFYLYCIYYNKPYESVIQIKPKADGTISAICFFDIHDINNYYACGCLYEGSANISHTHANFQLVNKINPADEINLIFVNLFINASMTSGIISSISERRVAPCTAKAILSKKTLSFNDTINEKLTISPKEIKNMRRTNLFIIDRN